MSLSHPTMTWLQLVLLGAVALHATHSLDVKLDRKLEVINPDNWPGLYQVPDDVLARAAFVVTGGGDGYGTDVLVHTTDSRTYVYGYYGKGKKMELRGIRFKEAQIGMRSTSRDVFFMLLTDGGEVYTAGYNSVGQLGYKTSGQTSSVFGKVPGLTNIVQIAAGSSHSLALGQDAQVYFWGDILNAVNARSGPVKVNFPGGFTPRQIASGYYHCLVLSKDGQTVMGWGRNHDYQLGLGSNNPNWVSMGQPRAARIPAGVQLHSIYAGGYTGFALDVRGQLWQWGADYNGALGQGDGGYQPTPTTDMPTMKDRVVSSLRVWREAAVAVTEDNEVYRWGQYKDGVKSRAMLVKDAADTPLDVLANHRWTGTAGAARLAQAKQTEHDIQAIKVQTEHDIQTIKVQTEHDIQAIKVQTEHDIQAVKVQAECDIQAINAKLEHEIQDKVQMEHDIQTLKDTLTGLADVITDNIVKKLQPYVMGKNFLSSQDVEKSSNDPVPE